MSNPFSAVFDAIGSVASFVIDNALPIVETVALNYFAPGISSALGISELATKAIGNAAISALNGGSIASIATAGIMPFLNSPSWMKDNLGVDFSPSGFVSKPIADALGNTDLANIVGSAVGASTTGALVGAITGADIGQAALNAGLGSITSRALSNTWDSIKTNIPALNNISDQFKSVQDANPQAISMYKNIQDMQTDLENRANQYNTLLNKYNNSYQNLMDAQEVYYKNPTSAGADKINNVDIPALKDLSNSLTDAKSGYDSKLTSFQDYLKTNSADINRYAPIIEQLNGYQNQYDVLAGQITANNTALGVQDAIQQGDFVKASQLQNQFDQINSSIAKIDQTAMVGHDLTNDDISLLDKIYNAPDEATRNQLISQAKLNPTFATLMQGPSVNTDSVYQNLLPKLPEGGIGQPTPTTPTSTSTTPTTSTTPPPSKVDVSTLQPTPTNIIQNVLSSAIKQGIVSNIVGGITGGNTGGTQPTTTPTKATPPRHVDVSTLRPFTGSLPTGLGTTTTSTTPATTQPTGGLNQATNTPQTTTQTVNSGLTSTTQPQVQASNKPAQHVDISTLTPVTNQAQLTNLGLNLG